MTAASSSEVRLPPHGSPHHSRRLAFIDRASIDALLAPLVPDASDRAFVARCLLDEGPEHHRGANYVLLALLDKLVTAAGATLAVPGGPKVPMHLPPHLQASASGAEFPLGLSVSALDRLAPNGSQQRQAMTECLLAGPPQHALANAAMVALLGGALDALERTDG